jgi:hypothetical protein
MAGIKQIAPVHKTDPGMPSSMASKCVGVLAHIFGSLVRRVQDSVLCDHPRASKDQQQREQSPQCDLPQMLDPKL